MQVFDLQLSTDFAHIIWNPGRVARARITSIIKLCKMQCVWLRLGGIKNIRLTLTTRGRFRL